MLDFYSDFVRGYYLVNANSIWASHGILDTSFAKGEIESLIDDINQFQQTNVQLSFSQSDYPYLSDQQLNCLLKLIAETPSVTSFQLVGNFDSAQATQIAKQLSLSNIKEFEVSHSKIFDSKYAQEYVQALSDSGIKELNFSFLKLNDEIVENMNLKDTGFESLYLNETGLTENGFLKLIDNISGSPITNFGCIDAVHLSSDTLSAVDLSKTNLLYFILDADIESGAIQNLQIKNSSLEYLRIATQYLSEEDLSGLSESLRGSAVTELKLEITGLTAKELAGLDLKGTMIETLTINRCDFSASDTLNLDLTGTNVTSLTIKYAGLTDLHMGSLNFEGTQLEHIDFSINNITENGMNILQEAIKNTSVIDVLINQILVSNKEPLINIIHNENVLKTEMQVLDKLDQNCETTLKLSDILDDNTYMGTPNAYGSYASCVGVSSEVVPNNSAGVSIDHLSMFSQAKEIAYE